MIALAFALCGDASILLLDEPIAPLKADVIGKVMSTFTDVIKTGKTVLIAEHREYEIARFIDRFVSL